MKKTAASLLFSLLISIPVILPYFHPGYFPSHDGEWAVIRLVDMFRAIRDLQIPARYSGALNFGYGYPLFNFAYPFPYYLGVFIHSLGFNFVDTIKFLFGASVPLSAFFMFLASKTLWKNTWAGVISTIFYVYLPYRFVDLYVRGSLGESIAFVLFPLLFYLAIRLLAKPSSSLLIAGMAICFAILVTTHNIMTVLFLPIFLSFLVSQIIIEKKGEIIKPFFLSLALGLGLSAFFWLPALAEKQNIALSQIPIADRNLYFVKPEQLLLPRWGYGVPTDPNGFSYQLGWPHFCLFLLVFLLAFRGSFYLPKVMSLIVLAMSFLFFSASAFIWENIPLLSEINYPWTLLAPLGFLVSLLTGFAFRLEIRSAKYLAIFFSLAAFFVFLPYARPEYYFDKADSYYLTNDATTTSSDELMPLWVKVKPNKQPKEKVEMVSGQAKIEIVKNNSRQIIFKTSSTIPCVIWINVIYYPGWQVLIDGILAKFSYQNEKGVIEFPLKEGEHQVLVEFRETPFRLLSDIISLASVGGVIFVSIRKVKKINQK